MSNHPAYANAHSGHSPAYYPSAQSTSQHLSPYSSTPSPQGYSHPPPAMSQSYAYYQQQQGYAQPAPVQSNAATQMPASYAYQAYPTHANIVNLPQMSNNSHQSPTGYAPAQHQTYGGYGGTTYPQTSSQLYPPYSEHGQGVRGAYVHQRHSSSSMAASPPSPSSQSSSSSDRFPCPNCDKSFTRNFDRKRHMEIHLPGSSGSNRCRYCHKDYSRPDSLKRHLDNGCEKKPRS